MFLLILVILCYLALIIGGVMCMVAAFRQSFLWGLAFIFIPFAAFVFIIKYWEEAKTGFCIYIVGLAGIACTAFTTKAGDNFLKGFKHSTSAAANPHAEAVKSLSAQIDADRNRILDLQTELTKVTNEATLHYQQLADKRKALKPDDQASVHQFNIDAADYQKQVARMKDLKQQIATLNTEVDALMSQRAEEAKALAASKQVTIYSASWCGVCKTAKAYMDGKGIAYREVDVEKSPEGAQEYRDHGGTGSVPLIVVGDQKMAGFNAGRLDEMVAGD